MTPTLLNNKKSKVKEYLKINGDGIPVDPFLIAEKLGITVREAEFNSDRISGMIENNHGKVTIYIRGSDSASRKRFTLAHELGHYALHMNNDNTFVDGYEIFERSDFSNYTDRQKEKEANNFAADLLMPAERVKKMWPECLYSKELMAAKFKVSLQAMDIRLSMLGLV